MHIDPRVEPWLRKLLDGVENSNHAAEVIAAAAYDAVHLIDTAADARAKMQEEFHQCLLSISFTHAGWDVREMPPAQKQSEAAVGADSLTRARQIWTDNPDQHDDLRVVFTSLNPLVEMREIERAP